MRIAGRTPEALLYHTQDTVHFEDQLFIRRLHMRSTELAVTAGGENWPLEVLSTDSPFAAPD